MPKYKVVFCTFKCRGYVEILSFCKLSAKIDFIKHHPNCDIIKIERVD